MIVQPASESLRAAAGYLTGRFAHAFEKRALHRLPGFSHDVHLTWVGCDDQNAMPILGSLAQGHEKSMLTYFFSFATSVGLVENPEDAGVLLTANEELGAIVDGARKAYRRLTVPQMIGAFDVDRTIEDCVYRQSMHTRSLERDLTSYWAGRLHAKPPEAETYVAIASGLAEDLLLTDIISTIRVELVARALGHEPLTTPIVSEARPFVFQEISELLRLPPPECPPRTSEEESSYLPFMEVDDALTTITRDYPKMVRRAVERAIRKPERFVHADANATTPREWVEILNPRSTSRRR